MTAFIAGVGESAPIIDATAWLAPGSRVLGAVTVGADSSLWYGAVLRAESAEITIGVGTNLQDNAVVHTDPAFPVVVGNHVTVGHAAVLHGCRIGDGCLIGMSAVVMNGAVIGEGSIVAAGAVVPAGLHVPPGSLVVGIPAAVRRPLTEAEQATSRSTATVYIGLATAHRQALAAEVVK